MLYREQGWSLGFEDMRVHLCSFPACFSSSAGGPMLGARCRRRDHIERRGAGCTAGCRLTIYPLSLHSYPSHPLLYPSPGSANCHRDTPALSELPIPPACHQPQASLCGVPTAWPAVPGSDESPASHPSHLCCISCHAAQCQHHQPQWGCQRGLWQGPIHIQPHWHRV